MKFKEIKNIDVISILENATELFRNKKYQSKQFIEKFIGLSIARAGFYGLLQEDNSLISLDYDRVEFDSDTNIPIFIEGVVVLNTIPVNNGSGIVEYSGYGVLEVDSVVIYDGRIANITPITITTIADNVVTNVKLADMPANVIKGREGTSGDPQDLTSTQVRSIINVEDGSTADQTDLEIKGAYETVTATVTQAEAEAGSSGVIRTFTPFRVKQAILALAPPTNITIGTPTATTNVVGSSTGTSGTLSGATTAVAGLLTAADKTKLNGIETGATADQDISGIATNASAIATNTTNITANDTDIATNAAAIATNASNISSGANVTTNLSETSTQTTVTVVSSDGTDATLAAASTSRAGVMTKAKFDEVVANNAKTGITSSQANAITTNTAKTGITSGQASAITANTAKTGITSGQASAITANTAKTGISSAQATAITANTAKTGITSGQASAITANTAKTGITTAQADAIVANTAKTRPELTKSLYIETPANDDDIGIWEPGVNITITKVVWKGTGGTHTSFNIYHSGATDLWNAEKNATTTRQVTTSFTDPTCTADNYIRYQSSALSGTPTAIELTITYTED